MSELGIVSFGSAVIGALLTAFLQPLWTRFISSTSTLYAEISYHPFTVPSLLEASIDEYIRNYRLNIKPKEEMKSFLRKIAGASGIIRICITNRSNRSIDGIVVRCKRFSECIFDTVIDQDRQVSKIGKSCEIGSLRPRSTCVLTLWTSVNYADAFGGFDDAVEVSANEFDRIKITYPLPEYLESKISYARVKLLINMFVITIVLAAFSVSMLFVAKQP
jgi:hypothetical protein